MKENEVTVKNTSADTPATDAPAATDEHASRWGDWPSWRDGLIYDHGTDWCYQRSCHAQHHDGHPHFEHPTDQCQSWHGTWWNTRLGFDGAATSLGVYAATPFRFGRPLSENGAGRRDETRLVFEAWPEDDFRPEAAVLISVPIADARKLARHIEFTADMVDGLVPPK